MTAPADWERLRTLFEGALACPPKQRAAYLDGHSNGDDGLRREVETLLAAHEAAEGFLGAARVGPGAHLLTDRLAGDELRASASRLEAGSQLGTFEILEPIGIGGMGEVYRARDMKLGREVAIKILPPHLTAAPERRARFAREARVLAALNHPHIGAIYGLEEHDQDGSTALVLELVEGETLAERLMRASGSTCADSTRSRQRRSQGQKVRAIRSSRRMVSGLVSSLKER
jgi:eukaryotic-like serine/threonine-protein kinase